MVRPLNSFGCSSPQTRHFCADACPPLYTGRKASMRLATLQSTKLSQYEECTGGRWRGSENFLHTGSIGLLLVCHSHFYRNQITESQLMSWPSLGISILYQLNERGKYNECALIIFCSFCCQRSTRIKWSICSWWFAYWCNHLFIRATSSKKSATYK